MMTTPLAAPPAAAAATTPAEETNEDGGWEPVANVRFRDPNAEEEVEEEVETTEDVEEAPRVASSSMDFIPAPPPQFDNSPPSSIDAPEPAKPPLAPLPAPLPQGAKTQDLDEEISSLEREVLGEEQREEEEEEEISMIQNTEGDGGDSAVVDELTRPNLQYVYGEDEKQHYKVNRRSHLETGLAKPLKPAVKGKENVIEAEIRAQQERERALQLEHMQTTTQLIHNNFQNVHKKAQMYESNYENSSQHNSDELLRKKGASSPHDSDEGFVDPPVEGGGIVKGAIKLANSNNNTNAKLLNSNNNTNAKLLNSNNNTNAKLLNSNNNTNTKNTGRAGIVSTNTARLNSNTNNSGRTKTNNNNMNSNNSKNINNNVSRVGYTQAVTGPDGETVLYDAVGPPAAVVVQQREPPVPVVRASITAKTTSSSAPKTSLASQATLNPATATIAATTAAAASNTTETKIALEIRELKEREEELRKIRELRASAGKKTNFSVAGLTLNEDIEEELNEEEDIEDVEGGSSSSREILDDHLTSLTTTTDEGNFSECGDATSSEDKSSNGSNSRIMSPEVPHTADFPRPPRRVTVRPYQGDREDEEDPPVYARMKKESVIEREIRLTKERDEAFKKEKGLILSNGTVVTLPTAEASAKSKNASLRHSSSMSALAASAVSNEASSPRLASTLKIQQEIAENDTKEREVLAATNGHDASENKVTRVSDIAELPNVQEGNKSPSSSASITSSRSSPKLSPAISPQATLNNNRNHQKAGLVNGVANTYVNGHIGGNINSTPQARLTRSLSTTNLTSMNTFTSPLSGTNAAGIRAPKGLMEKFIASRGKLTQSAFSTSPGLVGGNGRIVATRPMRVQPKAPVVLRQSGQEESHKKASAEHKQDANVAHQQLPSQPSPSPQPPHYKRVICAEEKIQEELRDMQQREEELRRLRSRSMALSQPNLLAMELNEIPLEEEATTNGHHEESLDGVSEEGVDEDNCMRSAVSDSNLLEEGEIKSVKMMRRRSTLIAEWENRIQATTAADA